MYYCSICEEEFNSIEKHISEFHSFKKNCEIPIYKVEDFIKHFNLMKNEIEIGEILKINEENPFWIAAKELLSDEVYKLLKEEIVGKERKSKIRGKRRDI